MAESFETWCRRVTEQVDFRPDRRAIARELEDHYADHRQALLEEGYDRELASQRALEALGDPEEVGKALNHVHKYWLGQLWQASVLLVLLAAVVLGCTLWQSRYGQSNLTLRLEEQLAWEEPPEGAVRTRAAGATLWWDMVENRQTIYGWNPTFRLWVEMDTPFGLGPVDSWEYLELQDDQGPLPRKPYGVDAGKELPKMNFWQWADPTPVYGWTRFYATVSLTLDHEPEWVEISYPYGEEPLVLRKDWEVEP